MGFPSHPLLSCAVSSVWQKGAATWECGLWEQPGPMGWKAAVSQVMGQIVSAARGANQCCGTSVSVSTLALAGRGVMSLVQGGGGGVNCKEHQM